MPYATSIAGAIAGAALLHACGSFERYDRHATAPVPTPAHAGVDARRVKRVITGAQEIEPAVARFRELVGERANGAAAGPQSSGRREISWDRVPDSLANEDAFSGDYFNANAKSGAVLTTPGAGLRDSDSDFSDVNATYGEDFVAFSQPGTLAPRGSNEIDVTFRRAGSGEPAVVNGFGAVFVDPDLPRTSSLRYYDADGALLATVFAPPRADPDEYTFAGAVFEGASVARVRITLGTAPVGPNTNDVSSGGTADVVVLDDVIYGEPQGLR